MISFFDLACRCYSCSQGCNGDLEDAYGYGW